MPWLSGEEERPNVFGLRVRSEESRVKLLRLANNTKRSSKLNVSRREKPKTGQLVFSL